MVKVFSHVVEEEITTKKWFKFLIAENLRTADEKLRRSST